MVKSVGIPAGQLDLKRFFFATHTSFAILTKLLAYIIVGRYTDLPMPTLTGWKEMPNNQLQEQFRELEKGGPFRHAHIHNFLEGDFFAWYPQFFTPELADCLREIVKRLADYDPATLDLAPAPTQDLLKKLYHRLVSAHIRKTLGEFYTPDWLAQRLLNMLDGGKFRGPDRSGQEAKGCKEDQDHDAQPFFHDPPLFGKDQVRCDVSRPDVGIRFFFLKR
jgi:hypothetical protein